ncbi:MAG: hypothetical protein J6A94_10425 [Lachnospiraceae bacterium]|nr:hypothetical protein [Lachnospiraceae bacterium]
MLQNTSTSEYSLSEAHSNISEEVYPEELIMDSQSLICKTYINGVQVTLEFPEQSDPKAEQEFMSRLKEIYLRKIEIGSRQDKDSALESNSNIDSDMKIHKSVYGGSNTKEDKNHE